MFGCVANALSNSIFSRLYLDIFFRGGVAALLGLAVIVKSFRNRSRSRISAEDEVLNEQTNRTVKVVGDGFSAYSREEAKALLSA